MVNPLANLKTKGLMVPVEDIDTNTYVRTGIDQNRIEVLKLVVESDVKLPPIVLVPSYEVLKNGEISPLNNGRYSMVDGRHRLWVYKTIFDEKKVSSLIVNGITTEAQLISVAFQLNAPDGPLPPGKNDIEHTVGELLRRKVPKKEIPNLLGMPEVAIKKFINDVEARVSHAATVRAFRRVVTDEVSVQDAAKAEGIPPEKLKNFMAAGRRVDVRKQDTDRTIREVNELFNSVSRSIRGTSRSLTKRYEDGDVTSDDVIDIYAKMEQGLSKAMKIVKDLTDRFIAKAESGGE